MSISDTAVFIGGGQFGQVYNILQKQTVAFKVVRYELRTPIIIAEFAALKAIYAYQHSIARQMFTTPQPIGMHTTDMVSTGTDFEDLRPTKACYAMSRIPSLPTSLSEMLLDEYASAHKQSHQHITMCRLYFGKESARSRFFNSRNFPIDLEMYSSLRKHAVHTHDLPSPTDIAEGMGQMMATVHKAGYDCRDMEFVLAGKNPDNDANGEECMYVGSSWGFHAFDFDQMNLLPLDSFDDKIQLMHNSFFLNDPYFSRPRPGEELYMAFQKGYRREMSDSDDGNITAEAFFASIEQRQRSITEDSRTG